MGKKYPQTSFISEPHGEIEHLEKVLENSKKNAGDFRVVPLVTIFCYYPLVSNFYSPRMCIHT